MGQRELEKLLDYYRDRYEPAELVEHLGIDMEELLIALDDWMNDNPEKLQADYEHITQFKDDN